MNMSDQKGHEGKSLADRPALADFALSLQTYLRFHQLLGIDRYPRLSARLKLRETQAGQILGEVHVSRPQPPQQLDASASLRPSLAEENPGRMAELHQEVQACRQCALASNRQGIVLGAGVEHARLLVIGDYSRQQSEFSAAVLFGEAEDTMLWNMMRAIGLRPEEVFVTNGVKCCPTPSLIPERASEQSCAAHLRQEIARVRPTIICAMGEAAARMVLGTSEPVIRLRGRFHFYGSGKDAENGIPVMVTFHPHFLLQHGDMKKAAWQDLQMIQRRLASG